MELTARMDGVRARVASRVSLRALREYFRYHGVLAPGVRLLRLLPMQGKVTVVALAFVVPLLLLVGRSLMQMESEIGRAAEDVARAEAGIALAAAIEAVQRDRPDAAARLQAIDLPSDGRSLESFRALQARALASGADPSERWLARRALVDALLRTGSVLRGGTPLHHEADRLRHQELDGIAPLLDSLLALKEAAGLARRGDPLFTVAAREIPVLAQHDLAMLSAGSPPPRLAQALEQAAAYLKAAPGHLFTDPPSPAAAATAALGERAVATLAALQAEANAEVKAAMEQRLAGLVRERQLRALLAFGCVAIGLYVLVSFYRVMSGGLSHLQNHVSLMAGGDLSARPQPLGRDEIGLALSSLGQSLAGLADLFASVRQGVGAVSHAATEIAGANVDLANRTETSAERLQQVVAGLARYTEQLDACGQRIDEAVGVIEEMRLDAVRSRGNMERLLERMASLKGKSREIAEIVAIIDGIAFRTNILALNASVEAAKAGEAGRGFAVVAHEVRRLAMRSAESARDINDIVTRSTEDIEQGSTLADRAGATLRETDRHVQRAREAMQVIVSLTRDGQGTSQSMLDEVRELDKLTSGNRELVQQMAEASGSLSRQGGALADQVGNFKLV